MEEVPGSEESLLALDEQPALTGQDEEGLLIRLGVVNAALPGLEDGHIDPELRELDRRRTVLVGEPTRRTPRLRREPLGIAHRLRPTPCGDFRVIPARDLPRTRPCRTSALTSGFRMWRWKPLTR